MVNDGSYILEKMKKGNAEMVKWKNKRGYSFNLEVSFKNKDCWKKKNLIIFPNELNNIISVLNNFKLEV